MEADDSEILRLPEELLASIISLTSPPDAGRCAAVSQAFLAAADSDAVWSCFLPNNLPQFAEGVLAPQSKKGMFRCLSDKPALLPNKLVSTWLDKNTGAKCYMLSARSLHISWGDTIDYWEWIKLPSDEIQANNSVAGGNDLTRQVCLQAYMEDGDAGMPRKHILRAIRWERRLGHARPHAIPLIEDVMVPRKRADGWMEVELGEFYNGEGCDGEVSVTLKETEGGVFISGLIVWGIEIRTKQ